MTLVQRVCHVLLTLDNLVTTERSRKLRICSTRPSCASTVAAMLAGFMREMLGVAAARKGGNNVRTGGEQNDECIACIRSTLRKDEKRYARSERLARRIRVVS